MYYPTGSWEFCRKTHFEASWVVFWLLFGYKELKLTKNPSTGGALCGPLFQMPNISFQSLGISTESKFSVLGVKVIQRSRLSPFAFSNSFAFLGSWFFFVCLFAGHLLGFTLVEKAFRFFDGRKGSCTIFAFFLRNPWFSLAHSGAGWGHLSI